MTITTLKGLLAKNLAGMVDILITHKLDGKERREIQVIQNFIPMYMISNQHFKVLLLESTVGFL